MLREDSWSYSNLGPDFFSDNKYTNKAQLRSCYFKISQKYYICVIWLNDVIFCVFSG